MLAIRGVLVEEDVVESHFACNLSACRGACCWEGDWGAPLEDREKKILEQEYENIRPFLSEEGRTAIAEHGPHTYFPEGKIDGTPLLDRGACAYLVRDELGIARCGIERAYEAGATSFPKPLSCQLYPLRIERDPDTGLERLRYDRWDICSAACSKGQAEKVRLYAFVKRGLIRKFGPDWYEALEAAAEYLAERKSSRVK